MRVDPYAVAYLSQDGEIMTAWMTFIEDRDRLLMWTTPGLPAFP